MDEFEKLQGVINTSSSSKQVYKISYSLVSNLDEPTYFTDLKMQEDESSTEYNKHVSEMFTDENANEMHYNFLARGNATIIVPYMSESPRDTPEIVMPNETGYITTPIKSDIFIHKEFSKNEELFSIGSGTTGNGRRMSLNKDIDKFTHCIYNGYNSQQLIGDNVVTEPLFDGPSLRLANADNKYTIIQANTRKTTGVLYAKKTKRRE